MTFYGRIGQFLFFLGFLGLVIFFASNQAGIPMYIYFCGGSLLFVAGIYLMWKYRNPITPSTRFSTYRRMKEGKRVKAESLENAKYSQAEQRAKKEE
jgi:hypothetical protein